MAKRYCLAEYTNVPGPMGQQSWAPAVAKYPVRWSAVHAPDPRAAGAWALCVVEGADLSALLADPLVDALPDFIFDAKLSAMGNQARNQLSQFLNKRGLDASQITAQADAYRDVIRSVGRDRLGAFNENAFDTAIS